METGSICGCGSVRKLDVFPAFVRVADRTVTIVGDGEAAAAKARLVAETAARIRIVSEHPDSALRALAGREGIELVQAAFRPEILANSALVFAATGARESDRIIVEAARRAGIPVNAVDHPDLCDFLTPALVNRAPVAIAISTSGTGPVMARQLREKIEQSIPARLGELAAFAGRFRDTVENLVPSGRARRDFWRDFFSGPVAEAAISGKPELATRLASRMINRPADLPRGRVSLVGAGPGAIDLLTLRAQRLLQEADVIVHDRLVPDAVVAMGRRDAVRIDVGKAKGGPARSQDEINNILVREASAGRHVVRLKGGDPMVFGRAGEEITALRAAGIAYEIVPGITAALAAAAHAEVPLTLRGVASSLVFTTGHDRKAEVPQELGELALAGATVAVYMARSVAASVSGRLIAAGLAPDTPVAVIENAGRDGTRSFAGTLAELAAVSPSQPHHTSAPALILIGRTVAQGALTNAAPLSRWMKEPGDAENHTLAA